MEAGVTTATKRLRRASIAGLATIATVGGGILGIAGTASAFVAATSAGTAATFTTAGSSSLSVGASSQALKDLTLTFPANNSVAEYSQGEQITFTLESDGNGPAGTTINDGSNTLNTASFSGTPTVTADNGATAPTIALANGNGTNDAFTLTFAADAPIDTTATDITISGLSVNIGAKVDAGQTLSIMAKATTPDVSIFWNGAATDSASVNVGTLPQVSVSTSKVTVGAPTAGNIDVLGTLSIKVVDASAVKDGDTITLTLSDGTWSTAPTSAGTPAVTVGSAGAAALTLTVGADSAAGNTITLTGGKITGLATAESVKITLTSDNAALTLNPSSHVASIVAQTRLGGGDRYGTGSLVYADAGYTATSVVLTSGANYPDALSAQYLASQLSTNLGTSVGVLTTDPGSIPSTTMSQIITNNITTVYIVGGTAAVSTNVASQLSAMHVSNNSSNGFINVVRIGGSDRFATNSLADLYLGTSSSTTAFIATGNGFADALAIGPVVYSQGNPLVLTDGATLSASAQTTLQSLGITDVYIVGGTSAVSTAVETSITNLGITVDGRLAGADRTQTAAAVEDYEVNTLGTFNLTNVYIARGDDFADALVAGPDAGINTNPILLTGDPNTLGAGIPSVLSGEAGTTTSLTALGLTSAVSVSTLSAAAASLS
jgi:putative cell wall-binding protein